MKKLALALVFGSTILVASSGFSKEPNNTLSLLETIIQQLQTGERTNEQLKDFVDGRNSFEKKKAISVVFKHDKTRDGWELRENVLFDGKQFVPEIVEFLRGESSVNGDTMRARAKELNANLGQLYAEYLLEHQELIPKEWQDQYHLVFPGTVWLGSDGRLCVPCLIWYGGRWCLGFSWLGGDWCSFGRLVRPRG